MKMHVDPYMNRFGGNYYPIGQGHGLYHNPRGSMNPNMNQLFKGAWSQPRFPFLAMLNFLDLSRLMNDLVFHNLTWHLVLTKIPLYIPKFEGKKGEYPGDNVTTFHLWCLSNSLNHDSIRMRMFQCTLRSPSTKWYIKIHGGMYRSFKYLANIFINHF